MKTLALLLLSFNLHANCSVDMLFVNDEKLTGLDMFQITEALCNVTDIRDNIVMHKIDGAWARVLVNKKEIIYLHRIDKWRVIARRNKFDTKDWEKFGIPSSIR
jgi:hypothetical protein